MLAPGGFPDTVAGPTQFRCALRAIATDRHCRWSADEHLSPKQNHSEVFLSVGFPTQSARMQTVRLFCNTRSLPRLSHRS
jgi:hypothetical protein